MSDETYPAELRYHPEHDWVRVDGDEATFGVTWYAQDALTKLDGAVLPQLEERLKGSDDSLRAGITRVSLKTRASPG